MPKIAHHRPAETDGRTRVPVSGRVIRDERYMDKVHTLRSLKIAWPTSTRSSIRSTTVC